MDPASFDLEIYVSVTARVSAVGRVMSRTIARRNGGADGLPRARRRPCLDDQPERNHDELSD